MVRFTAKGISTLETSDTHDLKSHVEEKSEFLKSEQIADVNRARARDHRDAHFSGSCDQEELGSF